MRTRLFLFISLCAFYAHAQSVGTTTLDIQMDQPGAVVSSNLFGIFLKKSTSRVKAVFMANWSATAALDYSSNPDY